MQATASVPKKSVSLKGCTSGTWVQSWAFSGTFRSVYCSLRVTGGLRS